MPRSSSVLVAYIKLLRPRQWLKNLMLYFPPFLGGMLLERGVASRGLLPFAVFCLVSSAIYIINDILDIENDGHHPEKCKRPLPAGLVSIQTAIFLAVCFLCIGLVLALLLPTGFVVCLGLYIAISMAYTFKLKEYALVDIFCISSGFLLRLEAGGAAFGVRISEWLFLTVFLLSFFLSTGKRFGEKKHLGNAAARHRRALDAYPNGFLQGLMYLSGATVLVTYSMYVISKNSALLLYTVPLCCFGLMRYMFRILSGNSGDPTESLLKDGPLFVTGLTWVLMVGWGIYGA